MEEDFLEMADGEEEVEKRLSLRRGTLDQVLPAEKDGAIFDENGDRNDRLKGRVWQSCEQGTGGSATGTCRCHQHTGVEHDSHSVDSTILTFPTRSPKCQADMGNAGDIKKYLIEKYKNKAKL